MSQGHGQVTMSAQRGGCWKTVAFWPSAGLGLSLIGKEKSSKLLHWHHDWLYTRKKPHWFAWRIGWMRGARLNDFDHMPLSLRWNDIPVGPALRNGSEYSFWKQYRCMWVLGVALTLWPWAGDLPRWSSSLLCDMGAKHWALGIVNPILHAKDFQNCLA
jgi:hypothetical protein